MAADMCRLCLRLINKVKYIDLLADTTTTAMLKEFVPEAHLDLMENTKMCSQCVQQLEVSYNFKHGVLVNEANIQSKLKESGLKKIDLKLMLKDVAKRELKDDGYVCRMCLEICRAPSISLFDSPFNMIPYTFVKKMCQVVFALEFVPSDKPVLCDECWETLQTVYNLKKRCLKLDKRCRIYIDTNNILKLGVKDLVRFASENPLGDDHCSSDEEHFAYIKGELVTDTEMKFDSDEAFCLTSSISKIKEETTVKCELDVTSKDEEFQDEPEFIDLKTVDPEMDEVNGRDCKIEICDIKVDPEEDQILTGPSDHRMRHEVKILRDSSNPFLIPDDLFIKLYRLPKQVVTDILIPQIQPHLYLGIRRNKIPIHIKVLSTLHFLAQGSYQKSVGKDSHISLYQTSVSKSIKEVLYILSNNLFPQYVKFPVTESEILEVMTGFIEKFGFPNVLGAIDCTHVAVISPPYDDPHNPGIVYLNRKGYYSINVQAICDANLRLLAVNARYPGSTHDSAIWQSSTINRYLHQKFENGDHSSWLLGDSGYPLLPWLMTPIPDAPENSPEGRYTKRHCQARNVIERCFGVLKQRFRCLLKHRVLHYSHGKAGQIIYACAVLHNICINHRVPLEEDVLPNEDNIEVINMDEENDERDYLGSARNIRQRLMVTLEVV